MSNLLVVGSVALDTIETPHGHSEETFGGSATFFSFSASNLADVRLVGVVGNDFPDQHVSLLQKHGIDTAGLEVADGETFRWHGKYEGDMSQAITVSVDLNVFGNFQPKIPDDWKSTPYVFLANGAPVTQMAVLDQVESPKFVMADTMNLWIETARTELTELVGRIDALIINDAEIMMLAEQNNLIAAARTVLEWGPKFVVVKKGAHGAFLASADGYFAVPAFPLEDVFDPTGAGDSFAGGLMGHIAKSDDINDRTLRRGLLYGTVLASFAVESLGTHKIREADEADVNNRMRHLEKMLQID